MLFENNKTSCSQSEKDDIPRPLVRVFLFGFPLKIKQNVTLDRHVAVV